MMQLTTQTHLPKLFMNINHKYTNTKHPRIKKQVILTKYQLKGIFGGKKINSKSLDNQNSSSSKQCKFIQTETGLNFKNISILSCISTLPLLMYTDPAFAHITSIATVLPGNIADSSSLAAGFISAFLLILFSEIGDKTFFVAVLLSLEKSKTAVFFGTYGALASMTLISVTIGRTFKEISSYIPPEVTEFPVEDAIVALLLLWFGFETLKKAKNAEAISIEEQKEADESIKKMGKRGLLLSTFSLVFLAEWGDKSFISTAALASASSPYGVCLGAFAGHFIATSLAVLSGTVLSKYVSEKIIQYFGGTLFIIFAIFTGVDLVREVNHYL